MDSWIAVLISLLPARWMSYGTPRTFGLLNWRRSTVVKVKDGHLRTRDSSRAENRLPKKMLHSQDPKKALNPTEKALIVLRKTHSFTVGQHFESGDCWDGFLFQTFEAIWNHLTLHDFSCDLWNDFGHEGSPTFRRWRDLRCLWRNPSRPIGEAW